MVCLYFNMPLSFPATAAPGRNGPPQTALMHALLPTAGEHWAELLRILIEDVEPQSTSTVSAVTPSRSPFERRVEEIKPSKSYVHEPFLPIITFDDALKSNWESL